MGAVNFSLDPRLVAALKTALNLDTLVETGTFRGDTVAAMADCFAEIYSVELSPELHAAAIERFRDRPAIHLAGGDSAAALAAWRDRLGGRSVLYFLDAHWCAAEDTASARSECPLLDEIAALGRLDAASVIVIDDARLFLAPPPAPHEISQWPDFDRILHALRAASAEHQLAVVNDNIVFFPATAAPAMRDYGQAHGIDWLAVMSKIRDYDNLRRQFDQVVELLAESERKLASDPGREREIGELRAQLAAKENVIRKLHGALSRYRRLPALLRGPWRLLYRSYRALATHLRPLLLRPLRPRLGNLCQHPPQPLPLVYAPASRRPQATPRLSIVTPSFRQADYLRRTIDSVLLQAYPNLEYFVQDGGSQDGTVAVLEACGERLSGWQSAPDGGQSQAINLGFARCSGEIMAWLNSDDLLLPGAIDTVVEYFNTHPDVDVVYGNRLLIDEDDRLIGRWILPGHDDAVLSWADYVPQETLFWRRRIWDKAGGRIDESFRFAMDWDLLLRFRACGARFAHLPQCLGAFRIHQAQKTSAVINEVGQQEMTRLRQRELGRIPSRPEIRRAVLPFLLRHRVADFAYRLGWGRNATRMKVKKSGNAAKK